MKTCLCGCGGAVSGKSSYRHGHWAKTEAGALRLSETHTIKAKSK